MLTPRSLQADIKTMRRAVQRMPPRYCCRSCCWRIPAGCSLLGSIEQACRENITFMALACGMLPDHSTIAAFVSSMHEEIVSLFRDILLVCEEQGLLGGTHFA